MDIFSRKDQGSLGFAKSSVFMLAQDSVVSALSFVSNVFIARWLGPVQLGLFYIVNLIPSYSEKFGRLGMVDHAAIYYLGKKKYPADEIYGHITWIFVLSSLVPISLYALFRNQFQNHFISLQGVPEYYIWVSVMSIPFILLFVGYNKMMVSLNRVKDYGILQIAKSLIFIFFCLYFWWKKWDFFGLCLASLISIVIVTFGNAAILYRIAAFRFKPNPALIKDLFGYGWKIYSITILTFLHMRLDLLIVAYYLRPEDVSYYSMAGAIGQLLLKIPNAVSSLLFVKVSGSEQKAAPEFTARACRHAFFILVVASLVLSMVCWPVVNFIYGSRFTPLISPLLILLPGIVALGLSGILTQYFYGVMNPRKIFITNGICAVVNLTLNLLLTPRFGIEAAAFISSGTYVLNFFLLLIYFNRDWEGGLAKVFLIEKEDFSVYRRLMNSL